MKNQEKYKFAGVGLDRGEKIWAGKRFKEYLNLYPEASYSDLQLLESLVYRETLTYRYKKKIEQLDKNKKINEIGTIVPDKILSVLNDNGKEILTLKEKLGLFQEKKEDDPYEHFKTLEKKFDIWKENHAEERAVDCPFCSQKFFLNIRTTGFTVSKLKLFKNKVLCNSTLWRLYKENKFTKEEFAEILNVSKDYIDWLKEKIYDKPSK